MKKMILILLVMLLAVSVSYSQVGIRGGVSIATFGGDDKAMDPADFESSLRGLGLPKIDPTSRIGFTGGISYKIGLILGLSIEPQVLYTQKGALYEMTAPPLLGGWTAKANVNLAYIDIPVMVKYSLPIPLLSPFIEGGVIYSSLLSAKVKAETPNGSDETDVKDSMTKSDFSIVLGIGVELLMLDVDARYVLGQTKLYKDSDAKIYNRGFVITAGLRF